MELAKYQVKSKIFSLFIIFLAYTQGILSQEVKIPEPPYRMALGAKIGNSTQLSLKSFITSDIAFDASGGFVLGQSDAFATLVFEYHHNTKIENVSWYYGGGPSLQISRFQNKMGAATVFGGEIVTKDQLLNFFAEIQPLALISLRDSVFTTNLNFDFILFVSVGARYILF